MCVIVDEHSDDMIVMMLFQSVLLGTWERVLRTSA